METDDWEIAPCLTNGRMARLHGAAHRQTAATDGEGQEQIASHRSNYRACSSCTAAAVISMVSGGAAGEGAQARARAYDDGVKGKMTCRSNQP